MRHFPATPRTSVDLSFRRSRSEKLQTFSFFSLASQTEIRHGTIRQFRGEPANRTEMDSPLKIQPMEFGEVTEIEIHSTILESADHEL